MGVVAAVTLWEKAGEEGELQPSSVSGELCTGAHGLLFITEVIDSLDVFTVLIAFTFFSLIIGPSQFLCKCMFIHGQL